VQFSFSYNIEDFYMRKTLLLFLFISTSSFANYVQAPKLYTRAEMKKLSAIEFRQILTEANDILPKKSDYPPAKPGEVTTLNFHWQDAGASLHEIAQIIRVNKRYTKKGLSFFEKCAKDTSVMTEFAAICFTHYSVFHKINKLGKINTDEFPKDVVKLSALALE
jgi:hypothetical protein